MGRTRDLRALRDGRVAPAECSREGSTQWLEGWAELGGSGPSCILDFALRIIEVTEGFLAKESLFLL